MEVQVKYKSNIEKYEHLTELPLLKSPVPVSIIVILYLLFIKFIGPCYMKNRPAFNLNKVLIFYNAAQVFVSFYIFNLGIRLITKHGLFDSSCASQNGDDYENLIYAGYCYFLAKVSELLDTIFFVLRKKQSQVTFLHIYHHTCMVVLVWGFLRFETSYCSTFLGTINSFVHIVMYAYYGLSAIPALRQYLWWKKYLTSMQLIQFSLILLHIIVYPLFSTCPPSKGLYSLFYFHLILFLYLFSKFYINTYMDTKRTNETKPSLNNMVCSNIDENDDNSNIDDVKFHNGVSKLGNGIRNHNLNKKK